MHSRLLTLTLLVGAFLFGFGLCGAYIYFSDRLCPVETMPGITLSPLEHLLSDPRNGEQHASRWIVRFSCEAKASDVALVLFTYGLMVATSWLAWATLKVWRAGESQISIAADAAETARDALITTERAFVFLDDFDCDWSVHPRGASTEFGFFHVKPRWRNSGTTPTRSMAILVNWTHWEGDPAVLPYLYGEEPVRMFLAPQATEWSEAIKIPGNVATDALNEKTHIFIWGRVEYEDIFDDTALHFTQWCYRLRFLNKSGEIRAQFVAFGDYNKSDEDSRPKNRARVASTPGYVL